jgi:hypothetical protein
VTECAASVRGDRQSFSLGSTPARDGGRSNPSLGANKIKHLRGLLRAAFVLSASFCNFGSRVETASLMREWDVMVAAECHDEVLMAYTLAKDCQ